MNEMVLNTFSPQGEGNNFKPQVEDFLFSR